MLAISCGAEDQAAPTDETGHVYRESTMNETLPPPRRPPFALRPAAPDDTDAIAEVWYAGWSEAHLGHVPDALLAHRSPDRFRCRVPDILGSTTVATADDRVIGLVVTHRDEIEQLYLADGHRGSGIATALLRHGETVIADRYRAAFLAVVAGNARARRFYEREGWHDAGPLDYSAWTSDGTRVAVACHRYEKDLPAGPGRRDHPGAVVLGDPGQSADQPGTGVRDPGRSDPTPACSR